MKKILFLFAAIIPLYLSAQRFNGGILAGISASQVDGDSYAGFDKLGLQGGVFVNTMFTNNLGVQMEIKYTGKGARKKTSESDPEIYKLTLHYIDIPVLLKITAQKKIIFEAGLVPSYLFGSAGEDSGGKLPKDFLVTFNKFDLSWLLGFRYNINEKFSAGIRYSYSFTSIRDYENKGVNYSWIANLFGYTTGDYNNYITLGLYYQFY